jgi:hypothetical protein
MLTALILVCSLATVPNLGDCTRDNALDVVYVPATFANPATCFMHGQAYLADSEMGRNLARNEAVKVVCVRSTTNRIDKQRAVADNPLGATLIAIISPATLVSLGCHHAAGLSALGLVPTATANAGRASIAACQRVSSG